MSETIQEAVAQPPVTEKRPRLSLRLQQDNPFMVVWLLALAAAIIAVCSKSSFLYPYNDWVDAHCYMTVARGILNGQMPYLDLIEQKGPLHYLLHVPAALIQSDGFFGVYLLEVLAAWAFLWAAYRTLRLYGGEGVALALPFLAALVYSSRAFSHGDSAEELCLPFLAWALYLSLRAVKEDRLPTPRECLCIGLLAAGVLWIKFSMMGLFLGILPIPLYLGLRRRQWRGLAMGLGAAAGGVLLLTAPIFLWLGANGALDDCLNIYIHNNLFAYSNVNETATSDTILANLRTGVSHIRNMDAWMFFGILLSFVGMLRFEKWTVCVHWLLPIAGMLLSVFAGGRYHGYYVLAFGVFPVGGFITLRQIYGKFPRLSAVMRHLHGPALAVGCVVAVLLANSHTSNAYLREYSKEQMPQFRFAEHIEASEDKTLINYGFLDGGFYTASGAVPVCRYFCTLNTLGAEAMQEQNAAAAEGKAMFIVTRSSQPHFERYTIIDSATFPFEGYDFTYYLYKRID